MKQNVADAVLFAASLEKHHHQIEGDGSPFGPAKTMNARDGRRGLQFKVRLMNAAATDTMATSVAATCILRDCSSYWRTVERPSGGRGFDCDGQVGMQEQRQRSHNSA